MQELVVIAIGGNSLIRDSQHMTVFDQYRACGETSRHIAGIVERGYRVVDFRREKFGVPAKVASIEYDPNRSARIALLNYADGEKRHTTGDQHAGQLRLTSSVSEGEFHGAGNGRTRRGRALRRAHPF